MRGLGWWLGLYVGWIVALLTLAITTANPPQLNLLQLSRATLIVTATVEDIPTGRCSVQRTFSPAQIPPELHVTNLSETGVQVGRTYLLPLVRDLQGPAASYRVVDFADRAIPPFVYPADDATVLQLERWQHAEP
ncbi:MAG: hypothetical protein ACK5Q5_02100 [Planctomycetaceae bacterium]